MDFARKQLEKYGWSDGKGLGKHENGISEALKPKLKRSVTGIGHDAAAEFNEHWWSALYDKAAKNVQVEEKNGKTKKIKTVDGEEFLITNNTWRINKKQKDTTDDNGYSEYFIKKAILTNDGTKVENVTDSETENDDIQKKDVFKMTDEELFAACEGRTAHKGARHGLKATGKLARIAQQELMLLTQPKYEGYSHAKKIKHINEDVVEDMSLTDDQEIKPKNKKKKKRKRCFSNENADANITCGLAESEQHQLCGDTIKKKLDDNGKELRHTSGQSPNNRLLNPDCNEVVKKSKKKKKRFLEISETAVRELCENEESRDDSKRKRKKRSNTKYN